MNTIKSSFLVSLFLLLFSSLYLELQAEDLAIQKDAKAPFTMVIFGATGDHTARKLMPALYNLAVEDHLSDYAIIGFGRSNHTDRTFQEKMREGIDQFSRNKASGNSKWDAFKERIYYHQSSFEEDDGYIALKAALLQIDSQQGIPGNHVFYLASPPSYFPIILQQLYKHNLIKNSPGEGWTRVVIEKPFGLDLETALELKEQLGQMLDPGQVFLMDHYLGKEGVQNILRFRSAYPEFEDMLRNTYIENIQITMSEDIGIGSRAKFWEETGGLRDFFQNHLMQIFALMAMELPGDMTASNIHQKKIKVLNEIESIPEERMDEYFIRGQYGQGTVKGEAVPGYRDETGVPADSQVETFLAAKLFVNNVKWRGVPFYIRGGKRMAKQMTEAAISLKTGLPWQHTLYLRIQPNPQIFLIMEERGSIIQTLEFPLSQSEIYFPEAYERLFYDIIRGDSTLFVDMEEHLSAWRLLTPILRYWEKTPAQAFPNYEAGEWGPREASDLLEANGHSWLPLK